MVALNLITQLKSNNDPNFRYQSKTPCLKFFILTSLFFLFHIKTSSAQESKTSDDSSAVLIEQFIEHSDLSVALPSSFINEHIYSESDHIIFERQRANRLDLINISKIESDAVNAGELFMIDLAKLIKDEEECKVGFVLISNIQIQWISQQYVDEKEISNAVFYYIQKPSTNVILLFAFFTDGTDIEFTEDKDLHKRILESIKW
jgi:hypothetical protein